MRVYNKRLKIMHERRVKNIIDTLKPVNKELKKKGVKFLVPKYGTYIQLTVFELLLIPYEVLNKYHSNIKFIEDKRLKDEAIENCGKVAPVGYVNPYWDGQIKPRPYTTYMDNEVIEEKAMDVSSENETDYKSWFKAKLSNKLAEKKANDSVEINKVSVTDQTKHSKRCSTHETVLDMDENENENINQDYKYEAIVECCCNNKRKHSC